MSVTTRINENVRLDILNSRTDHEQAILRRLSRVDSIVMEMEMDMG
jgi:hypothetical protein